MRLLLQEMKKIWNPVVLCILILFGVVYYVLFSNFYIRYFANGDEAAAEYQVAAEWVKKYGSTLDDTEIGEITVQLEQETELFGTQVKVLPCVQEYGIETYYDFIQFKDEYYADANGQADLEKERTIWTTISSTNYYRIQSIISAIDLYENKKTRNLTDDHIQKEITPNEFIRLQEIDESNLKYGYLPAGVLDSTFGLIISFSIWVVISIIILLSPTVVRDRLNRIQDMQFSSTVGRKIWNTQIRASLLSALLLTLVNILVYGSLLISKGALAFRDLGLFSVTEYVPWVNWTYGMYLVVIGVMILILGIAAAGFTVFLSRYSQNYISMLLKAIPLMLMMIGMLSFLPIVNQPFFMFSPMSIQFHFKGQEVVVLSGVLAVSVLFLVGSIIIQKRKELAE